MKRKMVLATVALLLIFRSTGVFAGPFETFTAFTAQNPAAVVAAIDEFFASDDSTGYDVVLVESIFTGANPATHYIVAEYEDYADFVDEVQKIRTVLGTSIYKKVKAWSK